MYEEFQKFWDKKWLKGNLIENNNFASKVLQYKEYDNSKILDLGCGLGRDSFYFASNGFLVDAFDFSKNSIEFVNKISLEKGVNINSIFGNIVDYKFLENNYDIIYSCNSLHYFDEITTENIINKLKKILKTDGLFLIRVKSINDSEFGKGEKISKNFYKNLDDIKHYFELEFLKKMFFDFEILEISYNNDLHDKLSGEKSINGFLDLVARKI